MTSIDARTISADPASRAALERNGLDYRLVEPNDTAARTAAVRAISRGFLDAEPKPEALEAEAALLETRRLVGVYDGSAAQRRIPVGTVASWVTPLTVPGGELEMWAISEVTVAGTHRRRGISRAMLEGELRAAARAGIAIAGLTVSEATIYRRYGFGPATWTNDWTVDTRRAGWTGPEGAGRLHYLDPAELAEALGELHERTRGGRVGDVPGWDRRWRQLAGATPGESQGDGVRGVRYVDAQGVVQGALAYRIVESEQDWARSRLEIRHLVGATAEARAELWRFALQHDLIGTVTASDRPVDEVLPWLIADRRAAAATVHDREWLRIIDLSAAFAARRAAAACRLTIRVSDELGFADGTWRFEADPDQGFSVEPVAVDPDGGSGIDPDIDLELDAADLASLYLGGVGARVLAEARRIRGSAEAMARFDAALRVEEAPYLAIGY